MKECKTCKQVKELTEFSPHKGGKQGRQPRCRKCVHAETVKKKQAARAWLVDFFKSNHCSDCGNSDLRVLEFDHTQDNKRACVADLVARGYALHVVKEEVAKCDVVCANCHRIRTISRLESSWRVPV